MKATKRKCLFLTKKADKKRLEKRRRILEKHMIKYGREWPRKW